MMYEPNEYKNQNGTNLENTIDLPEKDVREIHTNQETVNSNHMQGAAMGQNTTQSNAYESPYTAQTQNTQTEYTQSHTTQNIHANAQQANAQTQNYTQNHTQYTNQTQQQSQMHSTNAAKNAKEGCYAEQVKKGKKKSNGWAKLIAGCLIVGIAGGTSLGAGYGIVQNYYNNAPTSVTTSEGNHMVIQQTASTSAMSVVDVVSKVKPSVVSITTKIEGVTQYYGAFSVPYQGEGAGSGVIFYSDDDKIAIVTNNHVIEDATEVYATINDTASVPAKVVGTKSDSDLAVLTISWDDLRAAGIEEITVAEFGNSDEIEVGESVIAIGNAMGQGLSATDGIVSIKNQTISVDNNTLEVIQTSAAINSGNSGGALVNSKGQVIGINTAKYNSSMAEGMGYAIPSNEVAAVAQDLLEDGTASTPYIGIMGTSITSGNASLYKLPVGALVVEVTEGGPAQQAGLQAGDIITEFNGQTVMDMETLTEIVKGTEIGQTVSVHIIRNGETGMDLSLTIADKNA